MRPIGLLSPAVRIGTVAFVTALAVYSCLFWMHASGVGETAIDVKPDIKTGMSEVEPGVFESTSTSSHHMLAAIVPLESGRDYEVRFTVRRAVRGVGPLIVDFFNAGYDNDAQERHIPLRSLTSGQKICLHINAGIAPREARLRFFYNGLPGLQIAQLGFLELPFGWRHLVSLSAVVMLLALGGVGYGLLPKQQRLAHVASWLGIGRRISGTKASVSLLYLVAALFHYVGYMYTPYWSGDEYIYKSIGAAIWQFGSPASLTASAIGDTVNFPNLLYPYFIAPAFSLQGDFYSGVRLLNALAMSSAVYPTFLIAARYGAKRFAFPLSAFAVAIPFMWLGGYAVTEVIFYPIFLWNVWLALRALEHRSWARCALLGLISAVLMNVRPNGFIVLAAYLVTILLLGLRTRSAIVLLRRPTWLAALVGFGTIYPVIQAWLGVQHVGGVGPYSSLLSYATWVPVLQTDPRGLMELVLGHIATISIPYALPIGILVVALARPPLASAEQPNTTDVINLHYLIANLLLLGLALTILFTVRVAPVDLGGLSRLHARYYFYVLPLVLVAVSAGDREKLMSRRVWAAALAACILGANFYFLRVSAAPTSPWFGSIVDNMDVQWYRNARWAYWPILLGYCVLTWKYVRKGGIRLELVAGALVAYLIVANYGTMQEARFGTSASDGECGQMAARYLRAAGGSYAVVADSRPAKVEVVFWIPTIPIAAIVTPKGDPPVNLNDLYKIADFVIVNGNPKVIDDGSQLKWSIGRCRLFTRG